MLPQHTQYIICFYFYCYAQWCTLFLTSSFVGRFHYNKQLAMAIRCTHVSPLINCLYALSPEIFRSLPREGRGHFLPSFPPCAHAFLEIAFRLRLKAKPAIWERRESRAKLQKANPFAFSSNDFFAKCERRRLKRDSMNSETLSLPLLTLTRLVRRSNFMR